MPKNNQENSIIDRPPVIVITGHIDHGKSTLLDYIRKTNIVAGEAGGITQHLSAYEVVHKNEAGVEKKITFLDTPGHEAFSNMRERGVGTADVAILIVSAEDGVKAQTIEAWNTIKNANVPVIVAINKIDKPAANVEKAKMELSENGVYLEGYGGDIPFVLISAKAGTGVPELLDTILLISEMGELKGNEAKTAEGVVIEAKLDTKKGVTATLLIKDGTLNKGMYIVSGDAISPVRAIEDFLGRNIDSATFSSPIRITGFDKVPNVGKMFFAVATKKEAEQKVEEYQLAVRNGKAPDVQISEPQDKNSVYIPLIVKTDVLGTLEAIEKELSKLNKETIQLKIIQKGVGNIAENDVKMAMAAKDAVIIAFNIKTDSNAADLALRTEIEIHNFNVIYKISEWLEEEMEKRRPRIETEEITGKAKIIKVFNKAKDKQVAGGKVSEGIITLGSNVRITRRDFELGKGKIVELQQQKLKTKEVAEGLEFGIMIESKVEIAPGDVIESFVVTKK